jgi:pimeloyl-ACP methyl ester carboxylesterase
MATYLLVHGAWHGGWCWKKVAPLLRAAGHEVFTPTLIGLGDRAHLLAPDINLTTHITDIVNVLAYEDLRDVILVGHSYAGLVITGVAQHSAHRLAHLVYLDALFPMEDDRSWAALVRRHQPAIAAMADAQIRESGERWLLPPPSGEMLFGITDPTDWEWVRSRLTL